MVYKILDISTKELFPIIPFFALQNIYRYNPTLKSLYCRCLQYRIFFSEQAINTATLSACLFILDKQVVVCVTCSM